MVTTNQPSTPNFGEQRMALIEAFATLEKAVVLAAKRFGAPAVNACASLGQRLDALAKVKAGPALSKKELPSVLAAVEAAKALTAVRNDIVHSHQYVIEEPLNSALYLNIAQAIGDYPIARLLNFEQHNKLKRDALAAARAINPSPSQPQPSPDAAAAP